jgi:hypothetical protein
MLLIPLRRKTNLKAVMMENLIEQKQTPASNSLFAMPMPIEISIKPEMKK